MKIILADLNYVNHATKINYPVPLNVGYIGAYLKKHINNVELDIFKDPAELIDTFNHAKDYHVIGLSNYDWNKNLNRNILRFARKRNPDIVTIMGGPSINIESESDIREFFIDECPYLDFYIIGEGEYRFKMIIQSLIDNNMDKSAALKTLPNTVIGFDRKKNTIARGFEKDIGYCDCSTIPSPYLTGILDKFLDNENLVPIIETHRGCPYSCAFCCWGQNINSKIRQFRLENVLAEIEYIPKRTKNPLKQLYSADANFGILKRDIEIAQALKDNSIKNGFPKQIYIYFAKNFDEKVLKVAEVLKGLTRVPLSKQTLNENVLKIIGRSNISAEQHDNAYARLQEIGMNSGCELISGLPGESLESFLDGFEKITQKGLKVAVYSLLLIRGAKINSKKFRERYRIESAFRIIAKSIGSYNGINSVEYEEIVVSHSELSRDDFFKIRLVHLFYYILCQDVFLEFNKFLREKKMNVVSFIRHLIDDRSYWPASLESLVMSYENDVRSELIEKENLKTEFSKEEIEHIKKHTKILYIWYVGKLISSKKSIADFKQYLLAATINFSKKNSVLIDYGELCFIINVCFDKLPDIPDIKPGKVKGYVYDLEAWLSNKSDDSDLSQYRMQKEIPYEFKIDKEVINLFNEQYKEHKDKEISLYNFFLNFTSEPLRSITYRLNPSLKLHTNIC